MIDAKPLFLPSVRVLLFDNVNGLDFHASNSVAIIASCYIDDSC